MTKKPHYSFFTAPILLAAAVLQACVGGNTIPKVLSVKTPAEAPSSIASSKVSTHASQLEEKHGSAHLSSLLTRRELAVIPEREVPGRFRRTPIAHTRGQRHKLPQQARQVPPLSIESLFQQLLTLDCMAKTVTPSSATRTYSALDKAYARLSEARKSAKEPLIFKHVLERINTIQADLAHFYRILGKEVSTPSVCFFACRSSEKALQIDFKRVSKIVKHYPKMAEAVVPTVLSEHTASLLHNQSGVLWLNTTKIDFLDDCLAAYPQHTAALLSVIHEALSGPHINKKILEVLTAFVEQHRAYATQGIRMLNTAFRHPLPRVRIMALQACARILHVRPQCSQHVDKQRLGQAFESMKIALQGPELIAKSAALTTLAILEKCNTPFLREAWNQYIRTRHG